jgi:hypothetical protein
VAVLTLEVVVLVLAEGFQPMHFLRSKTNTVNLLLLGGSIYAGLRPNPEVLLVLFFHHLFYFVKLAKALRSRRLDGVIAGLRGGLKSVHHIGFLLLIVFYVYAVIGTLLLGQNDPFHFGTLHWSLITLFAMSSLDRYRTLYTIPGTLYTIHSYTHTLYTTLYQVHYTLIHYTLYTIHYSWSSVMEVSIYGCDSVYGYPTSLNAMYGQSAPFNNAHSHTASNSTTTDNATTTTSPALESVLCVSPHAHGFTIAVYFVSFVFISAYMVSGL